MSEMRSTGLQTIFAFFLGLMVAAFVGVGVYTFYPSPDTALVERAVTLRRQEQAIRNSNAPEALTAVDRAGIQRIQDELATIEDQRRALQQAWGRRTSIIVIVLATLAMGVSLVRAAQLPVISNGLLLGGVFTMVYGVGWIIVSDTTPVRFFVMTAALAVTLVLGYLRFVGRAGAPARAAGPAVPPAGAAVAALDERVRALEARLAEAASALGRANPE